MTKVFISYHHKNDQGRKEHLSWMASRYECFEDGSVNTGDIDDDHRRSESIRTLIRDNYLRDTQVTVLLCGMETHERKHVDWELKSSMIDGELNKKSGILVINLPGVADNLWCADLPEEKSVIYSDYTGEWTSVTSRKDWEERFPLMPARIVDQLMCDDVCLSVVPWSRIEGKPDHLRWFVDQTAKIRSQNKYDLSRRMRRQNSPVASHRRR
ncbi:MAG: TIR domain-containing protein [Rhodobacteraceae bacterium]|nr:TIR domain-containing protein [Paracoccaceae bacterium]